MPSETTESPTRMLSALTSRDAVLAAMVEYDSLGQAAFLSKYGFGEARSYFLVHDGKEYDSKAITGVAYKNQHGTLLGAHDFSGGEATVRRKLRSLGFEVRSERNPSWVRDEVILALDLYMRFGAIGKTHPEVIQLSEILNGLPIHTDTRFRSDFRNPNGVGMKLSNFLALDPAYTGAGLKAVSRLDEIVWEEFHNDPERLARLAAAIRLGATMEVVEIPVDDEDEAQEGRILTRLHKSRERNQKLVAKRKAQRRAECGGALSCEACGFDFVVKYGERGDGFAECHHKIPLAESGDTTTRLEDLAILCANCHRMVHVRKPMLAVDELRLIIQDS